ncbi:penicillin-binding protein [Candidatus Daviesbacteria bacterium]|nr:penicillin-binding protein [Candidatus Daviesbacteria bacterium]
MPKRLKKKTIAKPTSLSIAYLLVKLTLAEIGQLPILIIKSPIRLTVRFVQLLSSIHIPYPSKRLAGRPKKFRLGKKAKIALAGTSALIFLLIYSILLLTAAYQLPTPTRLISPDEPLTTEIYDRKNKLLYRIYEGKNRSLVKLDQIPKHLTQATIAIEDQDFYQHGGVDLVAILRALYHNIKFGTQEGASTLTQQLIKNSLLTPEKSYTRKLREIVLAIWTERIYPKDQILQMYLNEAPYGGSIVGIAAAAQTYFGKHVSELTLGESSYLAGLPASPTQLSPYGARPELAKIRQKEVLERMVKSGFITQHLADQAYTQQLNIKPLVNSIYAPHFVFYIRDLLAAKYGARMVSQGGLRIYTTLDLDLQEKVEEIVKEEIDNLTNLNVQNGTAMVLDGPTGQILAMVGSRDYHYPTFGNFNVALSLRQPGSSIKPITYAVAFQKGFNPGNTILDTPVTFRDEWGNGYSPVNYDGTFHGPVSIRQALGSSLNIPAVKLLATVGVEPVAKLATDLGITSFDNPKRFGLALTLGAADVKMIEMMGVYQAFSQSGNFQKPTGILKVTDSKGEVLEEYKAEPKQILASQVAYLLTNVLSDDNARKMAFGPKSLLYIPGYEVAVKTGTSDNKRDNWTFGYTPKYVAGVWVGNPDNTPMSPTLASGITGAAPIWNKIMHTLLDGTEALVFEKPAGVAEVVVDGKKDLGQAGLIPKAMVRVQKNDNQLVFSDRFSSYSTPSAQAASTEGSVN